MARKVARAWRDWLKRFRTDGTGLTANNKRRTSRTARARNGGLPAIAPSGESQIFASVRTSFYIVSRKCEISTIGTRYNLSMKKLGLADYQALAEFRYQIGEFLHFSEQAVEAAGIEKQQYQFLLAIKGMPEGTRPRTANWQTECRFSTIARWN